MLHAKFQDYQTFDSEGEFTCNRNVTWTISFSLPVKVPYENCFDWPNVLREKDV